MPGLRKRLFASSLASSEVHQDRIYGTFKKPLFSDLSGQVLEIGAGAGSNLSFIPADVEWTGVEPNPFMHRYILQKAKQLGLTVSVRTENAEELSLPNGQFDFVISTLVLCSVKDPARALSEIRRVLKPGGRFLFIEHVIAPLETRLHTAQRVIRPVWKWIADGCIVDRDTSILIEQAGFSETRIESIMPRVPITAFVIRPHIMGVAVK